jgi:hypothetical protein
MNHVTGHYQKWTDISQIVLSASTVFLSIATVALALFTYRQAKEVNAQTRATENLQSAQFMVELNDRLRNGPDSYSHLIAAIDNGKPVFKSKGGAFTEEQVDDYLVMWVLLGKLSEEKLISSDMAYAAFSYDVEAAYQNPEIFCFVEDARQATDSSTLYSDFTDMAQSFLERDRAPTPKWTCK